MTTVAITPTPTRAVRNMTSNVRKLQGDLQHAWDVYVAQMKRAEAEYIGRVKQTMYLFGEPVPESQPIEVPVS